MNASFGKRLVWVVLVVGVALLVVSCATTGSTLGKGVVEKGSAKGGASLLMKP